ncbi:MAG: hypothetical protein ACI9TK_001000 [Flavobacteriaceae bacterium]|jgi:hypothetical protein
MVIPLEHFKKKNQLAGTIWQVQKLLLKEQKSPQTEMLLLLQVAMQTQQLIINRAAAMSDPSSIIKTPLQVDLNNFTMIALVGIGNIGGLYGPKASYKWVHKALEFSPLKVN